MDEKSPREEKKKNTAKWSGGELARFAGGSAKTRRAEHMKFPATRGQSFVYVQSGNLGGGGGTKLH